LTTWPVGVPVPEMERVLALGEAAVPALCDVLCRLRIDERDGVETLGVGGAKSVDLVSSVPCLP
jgi:hypothetical protein